MAPLPVHAYAQTATAAQLVRIALESPLGTDWPPPGMHRVGDPEGVLNPPLDLPGTIRVELAGDTSGQQAGGLWWATLLEVVAGDLGLIEKLLARLIAGGLGVPTGGISALANMPIAYEEGKLGVMRWIKTTVRGELGGGVEAFQFGLNLGNPGDDPDLSEADALTLSGTLATAWADAWNDHTPISLQAACSSDVTMTEVGVTSLTQTTATASDGTGGNLEQAYETAWTAYTVGSEPTGTNGVSSLPYEVSCAVTLQTDHRGPSGRGRIYCPPMAVAAMAPAGVFNAGYADACAFAISDYIDNIKAATPYVPVIVSRRRIILNEVTSINVGQVPDSQRRRRRSQDEARRVTWTSP